MVADTTTWHKPPFARHAAIYEALADILEGATPSAVKLALYLYRTCIGGKPEEIDIYDIPLGEKRATRVRNGKPYSPNTRRAALRQLEKLGLVKILKNYGRGIFRIAVQHLGDVRPFTHTNSKFQKLSNPSKNRLNQPKIEQTGGSNPDGAVLFTEDKKEQQSTENVAAVFFNFSKEEENLTSPDKKPQLVTGIKSKSTELNKNSEQELKTPSENKCSAPTAECLRINSDNSQAVDVAMPCTSEQRGLTSKPPQKLLTELNSLDNPTISAAKSPIPTNKAVPLSPEISSTVTPQVPETVEPIAIANPDASETVKAVLITNSDATEIIEAVAIANPDATETVEAVAIANSDVTEIVKAVPITNPDATEIIEAVAIANPDATEIVEAVTRATGGMNSELKICVLQHSLNEIQAAINLLQVRSQTKQISNPSGWVVDCLRGRWWEKTNGFQNSNPTNVVSSPASTGSSPTPKNSPSAQTTRITEDYVDPHYMPLETHRTLCEQFQQLGKEAFAALGIQQQIYLQWMHRFPQQLKQILNKLSTT
ncbi:hypothetical protein Osc7112_6535 (plasmid) [Oscillatoria nigro-viridis PCC 7112]|uniref:Uncharacterized protein n=1 Tax=Phormidium nigroviride PCC 7112 TaxID=179408 RepID=K9VTX8_9CYAN|nr:hypothetical protein [Oscillatoria nigro-viridis]AFZ10670.1 hypothetical protein Osc7112_6535 [Oscillatoria nigro-viridis PCC 7112]